MKRTTKAHQLDFFVADFVDVPHKDAADAMPLPFFALGKRPRTTPIVYEQGVSAVQAERNALQAEVMRLTSDLERERQQVDKLMNMLETAQRQLTDQRPRRGLLDRLTGKG